MKKDKAENRYSLFKTHHKAPVIQTAGLQTTGRRARKRTRTSTATAFQQGDGTTSWGKRSFQQMARRRLAVHVPSNEGGLLPHTTTQNLPDESMA